VSVGHSWALVVSVAAECDPVVVAVGKVVVEGKGAEVARM